MVREGSRRWERLLFWSIMLGYVALRVLQSLGADISFDDEDGWTLAAAWELLHGPGWPYQAYQLSDWECGTRLVAWLAVPFTAIFGPSLLALKLTGIVVSTVTLAGIMLLCRRCYGTAAAVSAALLYTFFPAPVSTYSVTAHGFHPDSVALQVFYLYLAAGCYAGPRTRGRLLLTGAVGGFAVFFAYISVIAVLAGLGPLLWLLARRGGQARRALPALGLGFAAGGAPLLLYNLLNDFGGLSTYHGSLTSYVAPTPGSVDRVARFSDMTLSASRHFSDLHLGDSAHRGDFVLAFWGVALSALIMPWLLRAAGRALGRARAPGHPGPERFLDGAVLLMALGTYAVFFISAHPVGIMHLVPVLVALLLVVAGRLGFLLTRGGLGGKALAVGLLACFLLVCAPHQLSWIRPGRFDLAASLEARHYQLWLFRAQRVYERLEDKPRLDVVRHLSMVVPFELAYNDEHRVHLVTSGILADEDPAAAMARFLREPPRLTVKYNPFDVAGLVAVNLLARPSTDAAAVARYFERLPPGDLAAAVETFGFHARRGGHKFEALLTELARRMGPAAARALARGAGRAKAMTLVAPGDDEVCGDPLLPAATRRAFTEGLGAGLARRMVRPVPGWVDERLCPEERAAFRAAADKAWSADRKVLPAAVGM